MCAPHALRMEQASVSRFNSQSTGRTLVGDGAGDAGFASPVLSPLDAALLPIVHTPDCKQWIDLEYLSPKILRELRRQYDPSLKDEPTGALAKGAAKVKAWLRPSKFGIDVRLRRRLGPGQDEVTDIQLVPQSLESWPRWGGEAPPLVSELSASTAVLAELPAQSSRGEVLEMPDTSTQAELSGVPVPSRPSTDDSLGEPLPRYEPRQGDGSVGDARGGANVRTRSPERMSERSHAHSESQGSITRTPTDGLSLQDLPISDADVLTLSDEAGSTTDDEDKLNEAVTNASQDEKPPVEDIDQPSSDDRKIFEELQEVIKALRQQPLHPQNAASGEAQEDEQVSKAENAFRNLRVAKKTTYETETDVEPPSPVRRKTAKVGKRSATVMPKRQRSLLTPKKPGKADSTSFNDDIEHEQDSLLRKPTLPKRVQASAGAEAMWKSLLQMQAKILGPEHPLVYEAKSDLARSRANGHVRRGEDLAALRKSKERASETLGDVHPWVAAFSEDLAKLEKLTGSSPGKSVTHEIADFEKDNGGSFSYRGADPQPPSPSSERQGRDSALGEQPLPSVKTSPNASDTPGMAVPRIVTALDSQPEPTHSPGRVSSLHSPDVDMLWSSSRPPHEPRSTNSMLPSLILGALANAAMNGISWIQRNYGPEQPVDPGKVRVRWTCSCGAQLHDDFVERRPGAARELERYLNRPRTMTASGGTPTSPSSSIASRTFTNSSIGGPPSSQTSWSSYNFPGAGSNSYNSNTKPPHSLTGAPTYPHYSPLPEPPWLLTCANEDRFTPKLAHLDMAPHKIRSDKDLALSLREHYFHINKKWWRAFRLRGLTTIEFVQFEVHQNRFADIRKCPDMPPPLATGDYHFEPADLLPPVSFWSSFLFRGRLAVFACRLLIVRESPGRQHVSPPFVQAPRGLRW